MTVLYRIFMTFLSGMVYTCVSEVIMQKKKTMTKDTSRVKKSIILSGLVGTGGLFVAKALGLVYSIPLSSILGSDAYMSYYGTAYRIYSYILNVFTAGFPFAIATLVARYTTRNDSKSLLLIRKISLAAMGITGLAGMLLMAGFSGMLAKLVAPASDVSIMAWVLRILALAIFFVPILSAFRGFYQGRKEMQEYAFSQAFEQLFRVGFLLSVSYLLVYVLHKERMWALYTAVMSTSIAAIAGILQIYAFDRRKITEIKEGAEVQDLKEKEQENTAEEQEYEPVGQKDLIREFLTLAIPYLLVAVMGYCDDIFNSILLPLGLRLHGFDENTQSVILSACNYVGTKLTAIPMILAPGFTSALIPHISSALEEKNMKKVSSNVRDCLNIIFYIGLPVSFCIFLYSKELYHILFYTDDLATSSSVVSWIAIEGFLGTVGPVVTNIMMALGLKKNVLKRLLINFLIKGILMVPFIYLWGFPGAVLSSMCGNIYLSAANLYEISKTYRISFKPLIRKVIKIALSVLIMWGVKVILDQIGLAAYEGAKMACLIRMMISGIISVLVYFGLTAFMRIPQTIFHVRFKDILKRRAA